MRPDRVLTFPGHIAPQLDAGDPPQMPIGEIAGAFPVSSLSRLRPCLFRSLRRGLWLPARELGTSGTSLSP